jgi:hypothetical protein
MGCASSEGDATSLKFNPTNPYYRQCTETKQTIVAFESATNFRRKAGTSSSEEDAASHETEVELKR